jgi:hypothetical protein
MSDKIIDLRAIDHKRLHALQQRMQALPSSNDIWYIHTVLAQCFLPYRDPKADRWHRKNGDYSIFLIAGNIEDPREKEGVRVAGLPYGAKPRLFQSYICTQVIKQQSPVISVERSMTAMMKELGLEVGGGKNGTIHGFKEQINRFAACKFTVVGPGPRGTRRHIHAEPFEHFDVWFPPSPEQATLWPSEIELTDKYYLSLKDHAVPFDFRALKAIQNKPRAQDIYLWMTQRLCRLDKGKPLLMRWQELHEMFGGQSTLKEFKRNLPNDLKAALLSYPAAQVEKHTEGFLFRASLPPIPKTQVFMDKSLK